MKTRVSLAALSLIGLTKALQVPLLSSSAFRRSIGTSTTERRGMAETTPKNTSSETPTATTVGSKSENQKRIVHFNHAGASPSPPQVMQKVMDHMEKEQLVGGYTAAQQAKEELSEVYKNTARLLHANDPNEIALVESATVAWTRLFYSMVQHCSRKELEPNHPADHRRKIILLSEAEYAANVVAACQWAKQHPNDWTVLAIPSTLLEDGTSSGILDLPILENMLNGRYMHGDTLLDPSCIALICITHIPTNSGIVNPVNDVGRLVDQYNSNNSEDNVKMDGFPCILYLVDACQSVGQLDINVQEMKCHGLAATGRKYLRGPRGTGFLHVPYAIAQKLVPSHIDHACAPIQSVPKDEYNLNNGKGIEDIVSIGYLDGAARFEFWESNIANRLGLGEAIRYAIDDVGLSVISAKCTALSQSLRRRLQSIHPSVQLHHGEDEYATLAGATDNLCGIVSFSVKGIAAEDLKEYMWSAPIADDRFTLSVVPATSTPLDSAMCNQPNLVRASLTYTNTEEEIATFCELLKLAIDQLLSKEEGGGTTRTF